MYCESVKYDKRSCLIGGARKSQCRGQLREEVCAELDLRHARAHCREVCAHESGTQRRRLRSGAAAPARAAALPGGGVDGGGSAECTASKLHERWEHQLLHLFLLPK